ncbi:ABC transporter ATP-binding protein [Clostridium sp. C8-1-8]|uniref:ABC transporter ATP-binding protein n=1 Tax=Clostridium sp. C8-1-8 TaxID=2698831 RepID=UPI00136B1F0B|nr:ABC transporter ATP-binding protein [Clostridium sp. C8-1-8]
MMMIELKNVSKIYGSKKEASVHALKNINLEINKGEMVAIVGKSGSGKSTLLNIIGCVDKHTEGSYLLNGTDISQHNENKLAYLRNSVFGFVLQYFGLIEDFTVYNNVVIPLEYGKASKKLYKKKIEEILSKLGIKDKMNSTPSKLSGGQCQRVAIARAIVNDPEIILADEPTGALDKQTGMEIIEVLKQLNKEGTTVIMVTHDKEIANCCNRIITIEDGEITSDVNLLEDKDGKCKSESV